MCIADKFIKTPKNKKNLNERSEMDMWLEVLQVQTLKLRLEIVQWNDSTVPVVFMKIWLRGSNLDTRNKLGKHFPLEDDFGHLSGLVLFWAATSALIEWFAFNLEP